MRAISSISSFPIPRSVTQGVPMRIPWASAAEVSPGMVFLLVTRPTKSSIRAAISPIIVSPFRVFIARRSITKR